MNNHNIGGMGKDYWNWKGPGPRPRLRRMMRQRPLHQQQQQQPQQLPSPSPQNQSFNNLMDNPDNILNPSSLPPLPSDLPPDVLTEIQNWRQGIPYFLSEADIQIAIEFLGYSLLPLPQQQEPVSIPPVQYGQFHTPTALHQTGMNPQQLAQMFINQRHRSLLEFHQPISPGHFLYQAPSPVQEQVQVQGNHRDMISNSEAAGASMNPNIFTPPLPSSQMPIPTMMSQASFSSLNPNAREFVPNQGASTSKKWK